MTYEFSVPTASKRALSLASSLCYGTTYVGLDCGSPSRTRLGPVQLVCQQRPHLLVRSRRALGPDHGSLEPVANATSRHGLPGRCSSQRMLLDGLRILFNYKNPLEKTAHPASRGSASLLMACGRVMEEFVRRLATSGCQSTDQGVRYPWPLLQQSGYPNNTPVQDIDLPLPDKSCSESSVGCRQPFPARGPDWPRWVGCCS